MLSPLALILAYSAVFPFYIAREAHCLARS